MTSTLLLGGLGGGAGSSGTGGGVLDIDDPSGWGADLGYDEEFGAVGTSLPTGWSWFNQGSSTYRERFGKGIVAGVAETGTHWRGITRTLPGEATWEAIIKRSWQARAGIECGSGFVLRADNGKILTFYWYSNNGTNEAYLTLWNDADGAGASVKAGPVTLQGIPGVLPEYLRIRRNSATSYDFAGSSDGVMWYSVTTGYNVGALLTPTTIGFASYHSANYAWEMGCEFFRVRDINWTPESP